MVQPTAANHANSEVPECSPRAVWDPETQEEHGGQTWQSLGDRFVCDFSVTTNALGPPTSAIQAVKNNLYTISHYPPADTLDALQALSKFVHFPQQQMLLGNGASEFIDLLMRAAPPGPVSLSPYIAAYMEYNRAAKAADRRIVDSAQHAAISVVIHPNSPTGDCMSLEELRAFVKEAAGVVVVDESFIAFHGSDWHAHSALQLIKEFPTKLVVLFSWTKLWACPGIRIGSVAASREWIVKLKRLQTPWSCNSLAQKFLIEVCDDQSYMQRTWDLIPKWRQEQEHAIAQLLGWSVNKNSPQWVPWVFIDCGSTDVAKGAADVAYSAGCPVRWCKSFGIPQYIRVGVRHPTHQKVLNDAWQRVFAAKLKNGTQW